MDNGEKYKEMGFYCCVCSRVWDSAWNTVGAQSMSVEVKGTLSDVRVPCRLSAGMTRGHGARARASRFGRFRPARAEELERLH